MGADERSLQLSQVAVEHPASARVQGARRQAGAGHGRPSSSADIALENSCHWDRSAAKARRPAAVSA
jgi:hypothetical protein